MWRRVMTALKSPDTTADPSNEHGARHNGSGAGAAGIGIGNLSWMRVVDVALPRADIVAVPSDITLPELVQIFRDSGMTRLPVYRSTLDTPIGMVHLKDLALKYGFNGKAEKFSLKGMLRPLLYAPPSMPIGVLLQKMQKDRMHMALVIDEYGGTDGLVTIEDLIEQVIGEIEDEHDEPEDRLWAREKPGVYLVQAKAPLSELEQELGLSLIEPGTEEEIDTLGGLVFKLTGRVPVRGEVIPHENGTEFEVVDADSRRIKRVRVRFQPTASNMAPAAE
jgi:magnesium and cobalt transporter